MKKVYTSKLSENRGEKRVWLESNRLLDTDFVPSTPIEVDIQKGKVTLKPSALGKHHVSQKRGKPIIDINNKKITEAFDGCMMVSIRIYSNKIVIMQLDEEKQQQRAKAKAENPVTMGEFFAGGGTLHSAFAQEGFQSKFAVDIEDDYLETLEANFPDTLTINAPIQDINWKGLPEVDVLLAGIPCECFSASGVTSKNANGKASKEAGDTGSLGYYVLEAIRAIRPGVVVIEEVPNFKNSMMADIVRSVLTNAGYFISENVIQGDNFGGLTKRSRFVLVASMKEGVEIPLGNGAIKKTVESILEIPLDEREWLTEENSASIATFKRREQEAKDKGNGFRMADCLPSDTCGVATVTKGYYKRRLTDPILKQHSSKEAYSFFTPRELARINGLPDSYILPTSKTRAGEIIGQGVSVDAFAEVARAIKSNIKSIPYNLIEYWDNDYSECRGVVHIHIAPEDLGGSKEDEILNNHLDELGLDWTSSEFRLERIAPITVVPSGNIEEVNQGLFALSA
jgi:DNA (cytosine-5)-methyltransferase 1